MSLDLAAFESIVAAALRASDPVAALDAARADAALALACRAALQAVDADGFRISALLVAKLRFERLLRGSAQAGSWFAEDPRAFTAAFREYHVAVAPTAPFPSGEARAFALWLQGRDATNRA